MNNEALIFAGFLMFLVLACIIAGIVENKEAIFDWLYDVGTAYYKFKHNRKRRYTR